MAEAFTNLHFCRFLIIGKGVCNDRGVILIEDVVLCIPSGENDVASHCDPCADESGYKDVLVVDDCSIYPSERCIHYHLPCGVMLFNLDGVWFLMGKLTCHFSLGLGKFGRRDPFVLLSTNLQGCPSCGSSSRCLHWESWCSSSHLCEAGVGVSMDGCVDLACCLLVLLLLLVLFGGCGVYHRCFREALDEPLAGENLLLQLGDAGTHRRNLTV